MHIAVLMGGPSPEFDISLASGEEVTLSLLRQGYAVTVAVITRRGTWCLNPDAPLQKQPGQSDIQALIGKLSKESEGIDPASAADLLRKRKVALCFLALHGHFGEDGIIQGFLDTIKIPYTGSGVAASSLAIDKVRAKKVLDASGLTVPSSRAFYREDWKREGDEILSGIRDALPDPIVVKPSAAGSSVGTSIARGQEELEKAIEEAFRHSPQVLMEEYIRGMELTCPVLANPGDSDTIILPVVEIVPKTSDFFDYEAKYTPGATDEIAPARIDDNTAARVADIAVQTHTALGCAGLTRSDMILADETIYVLEINTIPGMSKNSICPRAAAAAGKDFDWLTRKMVELAEKTR